MSFRRFIATHRETAQEERTGCEKQGGGEEQTSEIWQIQEWKTQYGTEKEREKEHLYLVGS